MNTRNIIITGTVLLMLVMSPGRVSAVLLVEETFNYAADTAVNELNGGTGWGGAWVNTDDPWSVTSPGLAVSAVGITSPDNGITCAATGGNRTARRDFASAYTNGVVYLGAILCKNAGAHHWGHLQVTSGINYGFRIHWSDGDWSLAGGGADANKWGDRVDSGVPVVLGEPVLAVLKIDIDNKKGCLYINQATEGTPDCSATAIRFGMLTVAIRGANNGSSSVDDIRVGTTYADVAAIPIPRTTVVIIR